MKIFDEEYYLNIYKLMEDYHNGKISLEETIKRRNELEEKNRKDHETYKENK